MNVEAQLGLGLFKRLKADNVGTIQGEQMAVMGSSRGGTRSSKKISTQDIRECIIWDDVTGQLNLKI